jgi:hypothetical protein
LFVNTSDHVGDTTRLVMVAVGEPGLYHEWRLESDPGWSLEDQWEFGQPTGSGGAHGGPDPTGGHTGSMVYGYNLNGDYPNNLPERHLTTTAIDCTDLYNVRLRFWRWLGVGDPIRDHAVVRVSTNGVDWVEVWSNPVEITDEAWVEQELDIAAVADNQESVYLRWTMGPTDPGWTYCGWNIDDIQIWAHAAGGVPQGAGDSPSGAVVTTLRLDVPRPNPFRETTVIAYSLPNAGRVRLRVFDVQGRQVATLVDEMKAAGRHETLWTGRNAEGIPLHSGLYIARVECGEATATGKLVLMR